MVLTKRYNPSAHWNHTSNSWWVGETTEYQWINQKNKPTSNWMDLDNALKWIIEYDIARHRSHEV